MAEQLPNDLRTTTLLQVARSVSRYDPERAAAVIAEVRQDTKRMDEETSLDLIAAQAFVAAGQNNRSALQAALRRGFASANRILLELQGTGRSNVSIPALTPWSTSGWKTIRTSLFLSSRALRHRE